MPSYWNGNRAYYRIKLLNINQTNIFNLNDLISAICKLSGNQFIKLDFKNYQVYAQPFDKIIISDHEKLTADLTLDNIDFNPRVFNFNAQKMEWEINDSPCKKLAP